ncbi:hypothetical protein LINPERHAP1_LOCUS14775 [Linum perenne]
MVSGTSLEIEDALDSLCLYMKWLARTTSTAIVTKLGCIRGGLLDEPSTGTTRIS